MSLVMKIGWHLMLTYKGKVYLTQWMIRNQLWLDRYIILRFKILILSRISKSNLKINKQDFHLESTLFFPKIKCILDIKITMFNLDYSKIRICNFNITSLLAPWILNKLISQILNKLISQILNKLISQVKIIQTNKKMNLMIQKLD